MCSCFSCLDTSGVTITIVGVLPPICSNHRLDKWPMDTSGRFFFGGGGLFCFSFSKTFVQQMLQEKILFSPHVKKICLQGEKFLFGFRDKKNNHHTATDTLVSS